MGTGGGGAGNGALDLAIHKLPTVPWTLLLTPLPPQWTLSSLPSKVSWQLTMMLGLAAAAAIMVCLLAMSLHLPWGPPHSTFLECTTAVHQHQACLQW